jgi:UPF0755 protein
MSDQSGRSAQEREAARLERERRRAERSGAAPARPAQPSANTDRADTQGKPAVSPQSAPVVPPQSAPVVPPQGAPVPRPMDATPTKRVPEPAGVSSRPIKSFPSPPDPGFYEDEDEDEDGELASGTRRVSRLDTQPARGKKVRAAKRKRPARAKRRPAAAVPKARHSWLRRVFSLLALAAAAALIWFGIELFQPFGTSPHGQVTVRIAPQSSASEIGDLLERDGVISSSFFFKLRATLAGERSEMRPGRYKFALGMSYSSVLAALTRVPPAAKTTELTITEGRTRHATAALLAHQRIKGSYLAATRRSPVLDPHSYGAPRSTPSLEGFLFPDTYQLVEPARASALATDQLRDFKRRFAAVKLGYAHRKHLTPYEVLTIASMVEAESATAHDRPLVASVIYNRLADHMMLQFDSTTRYATGNYNHPLKVSQLKSRSPWNTHTHFGLPPTPIGNPGMAAIQAAAHPARTKYLYFFAKPCSRGTVFATNYNEFLDQGRRYAAKRC